MAPSILQRNDLVEPELCYKIVGVFFHVYGALGHGHAERVYQRAVAEGFRNVGLQFVEQLYAPIFFNNKIVGKNYLDFCVENRVVVELKRGDRFVKAHIDQVYNYLVAKKLQLGILVYFGPSRMHYKRIVNLPQ